MGKNRPLYLLFFFLLLMGCNNPPQHIQFYTWKSSPNIGSKEKAVFKNTHANKLYLRIFDIDLKNGQPEPEAFLQHFSPKVLQTQYVPVVFITNRTFIGLSTSATKELAQKTGTLIKKITAQHHLTYDEIQIDSDWTQKSRDTYFQFLTFLKEYTDASISCTLRLHQVKYKNKTGIPPVKKVYLMCYPTSNPLETKNTNSIIALDLLKNYLQNINNYPLHFDIVLPLYSWAIVTNHIGRKKLINGITKADLNPEDFSKNASGIYTAKHNLFLGGLYLNKGFTVKVERVSPKLLRTCKHYLAKKINQPYNIVYFHLDHVFTQHYTLKDLS